MKKAGMLLGAMLLLLGASGTYAADERDPGASGRSPGDLMYDKGSVKGSPGASGYAPGHEMQHKGSKIGEPGASGFAPGKK